MNIYGLQRGAAAVALGLTVSLLGAGCTDTRPAERPSPASSTMMSPSSVASSVVPLEDEPQAPAAAELTASERAEAITLATAVMEVFATTDVDAQTWINGLYPLLTAKAAARAEGTEPALVPAHEVTGPVVLSARPTKIGTAAEVPTDAGVYTLLLVWDERAGVWLCDRIGAPQESQ